MEPGGSGADQPICRVHRRPSMDSRRSGTRQTGEPIPSADSAWLSDLVASRILVAGDRRRAVRRSRRVQLRARQGSLSRSGSRRFARPAQSLARQRRREERRQCRGEDEQRAGDRKQRKAGADRRGSSVADSGQESELAEKRDDENAARDPGNRGGDRGRGGEDHACAQSAGQLARQGLRRRYANRVQGGYQPAGDRREAMVVFPRRNGKGRRRGGSPRARGRRQTVQGPGVENQRRPPAAVAELSGLGRSLEWLRRQSRARRSGQGSGEIDYADFRRRPRSDEWTDLQSGRPEEVGG